MEKTKPLQGTPKKSGRIGLIDSLRGVASLMVVFYHLDIAMVTHFAWIPNIVRTTFQHGYFGVHIFFLLSGYVIAMSTERLIPSVKSVVVFAFRRGVRLDPPYWASIGLAMGLTMLSNHLFPEMFHPLPGFGKVIANVFYVQNILGVGDIVTIYWSLCFEIQMYLIFVILSFTSRWMQSRHSWSYTRWVAAVFWAVSLIISLYLYFGEIPKSVTGFFFPYWFFFFIGAMVRWYHGKKTPPGALIGVLVLMLVSGGTNRLLDKAVILLTVFVLLSINKESTFSKWMENRVLLFLGKLSYSLYLVHPIIGWRSISLMKELVGPAISPVISIVIFLLGVGVSVFGAWILFIILERPTMALSRRISPGKKMPA